MGNLMIPVSFFQAAKEGKNPSPFKDPKRRVGS